MVTNEAETRVSVETGKKRLFICALDWPGWCRSGKTEEEALDTLSTYAARYAPVAAEAGIAFDAGSRPLFKPVERVVGTRGYTDFGVPGAILPGDHGALGEDEADRLGRLVAASWVLFDRIVAGAPPVLRKGPRGGGRDRDAVVDHVLGAETAYVRKLGVKYPQPARSDSAAIAGLRQHVLSFLKSAPDGDGTGVSAWPPRYAARRIAWHVLDHAWEIEDRSVPAD